MSEPTKNPFDVLLDQIRDVVRAELKAAAGNGRGAEDRLLDIDEAAKLLSMSKDWLYHNRKKLPFARKLGPKMIRFSYAGMMRWLETKKFS